MKIIFLKILLIILLAILQLSILNKLQIFNSLPNVILILAIALLLRGQPEDGFLVAAFGGLILDLASPLYFGFYTFLFLIILIFTNFVIIKNFPTPNFLTAFFIFIGSYLIIDLSTSIAIRAFPWWQILFDAAFNGLFGVCIYIILGRLIKKEEIQII